MDYHVDLEVYHGPLDLLLYLIRRDELDIHDIPIARITDSYMAHVRQLQQLQGSGLDINGVGDFLVMAATLMEIKSATLVPRAPVEEGGSGAASELADPRRELVRQLLEYKRFKDNAAALETRQKSHEQRFPRAPARPEMSGDEPPPLDLDEIQIWDLLSAFTRLMEEVGQRGPGEHEVIVDDTPIDLHAADIEDRVMREGHLTLRALLLGRSSRSEMIGVFLALLELIREKRVVVRQEGDGDELGILPAPEEHRRTFLGASLHLSSDEQAEGSPQERTESTPGPGQDGKFG
jgi:segregation and condensation protein A